MKVLSWDPSGNWGIKEGMGTSGYSISLDGHLPHKLGDISSKDFDCKQAYWFEHKLLIERVNPDVCVIESYKLFGHKAKQQTGSELHTPQLIGYMEMVCYELNIPVIFQDPTTKQRHADDILVKMGILEKKGVRYFYKGELTNLHQRDALRHNLFFCKYGKGKLKHG